LKKFAPEMYSECGTKPLNSRRESSSGVSR
jgi:hypothetical protein